MNEKAGKVAGGRGPAIEILQARVVNLSLGPSFWIFLAGFLWLGECNHPCNRERE